MMEIQNGRAVFKSESVWQLIPNILAVLYPKDPEGYGATPELGTRYRIQVALEKLDELERATQATESKR